MAFVSAVVICTRALVSLHSLLPARLFQHCYRRDVHGKLMIITVLEFTVRGPSTRIVVMNHCGRHEEANNSSLCHRMSMSRPSMLGRLSHIMDLLGYQPKRASGHAGPAS
jgi:hypothetical protein